MNNQAQDPQGQTQERMRAEQAIRHERLRSLGQMASGIAHEINNAISPVTLYAETLLDSEPNLSARTRDCLQVILGSMEEVTGTVGRLREFSLLLRTHLEQEATAGDCGEPS
jgi:signal transduction histidine kinase